MSLGSDFQEAILKAGKLRNSHRMCSIKMVFSKILQYSQENAFLEGEKLSPLI